MAPKLHYDKTLFSEKRNLETGERELYLTIENSVEERVEALEKMLQFKRVLSEANSKK